MLFSSMTFIYVFLPIVVLLYLVTKKELHNPILLAASIIFYAWGEPKYLAIMLLTIIINYFGAIGVDKFKNHKKLILVLTILGNLGFLIYFKYFNFILENINLIINSYINPLNVIMPIGISFYTFQAMSYLIDVYREEVQPQEDIYKLALYICLFPQLVAGPIVKYHDVAEQITDREVNFEKVDIGVKRFIIGLAKKVLIANTLAVVVDKIFVQDPHNFSHLIAWLGAISYAFQLYFDFSGYSDMAIGLGLIFGFKFMENFNYPFISKSISEYWRRWHISLSSWFRDYLFYPITRALTSSNFIAKITDKIGRKKASVILSFLALAPTWALIGLWHGAEWTFIVHGLYNGFFVFIESVTKWHKEGKTKLVRFIQHSYMLIVALIAFVIFRSKTIKYAWDYVMNMFGLLHLHKDNFVYTNVYYIDNIVIITLIAALLCSVPIFKNMIYVQNKVARAFINIWLLILFFLSTCFIASGTYNPFIYFRF